MHVFLIDFNMKDLNSKRPKKRCTYNLKDYTYKFYEEPFSDFQFQL